MAHPCGPDDSCSRWEAHCNPPPPHTSNMHHSLPVDNPFAREQSPQTQTRQQQQHPSVLAQCFPQAPATRKAKSHRKRHVPVGPAGVWFQSQQQQKQQQQQQGSTRESTRKQQTRNDNNFSQDGGGSGSIAFRARSSGSSSVLPKKSDASSRDDAGGGGLSLCSSAWMCMQCELNLVLPSLPSYLSETERCSILRRCLPPEYLLLPDLTRSSNTEWKLPVGAKILVLIQTIQSLTDNLWTVEVTDETGATLTAWIQPKLVREEQQRQQPHYIRPGLVWLLVNPTIILSKQDNNKLDRVLLISQANIERVWTPAQAKEVSDEQFVNWLEQRNLVTSQVMEHMERQQPQFQQPESREEEVLDRRATAGPANDDSDDEEFTFQCAIPSQTTAAALTPLQNQNQQQSLLRHSHSLNHSHSSESSQLQRAATPFASAPRPAQAPSQRPTDRTAVAPLDTSHANSVAPHPLPAATAVVADQCSRRASGSNQEISSSFGFSQFLSQTTEAVHQQQKAAAETTALSASTSPFRASTTATTSTITISPAPPPAAARVLPPPHPTTRGVASFSFTQFLSPTSPTPTAMKTSASDRNEKLPARAHRPTAASSGAPHQPTKHDLCHNYSSSDGSTKATTPNDSLMEDPGAIIERQMLPKHASPVAPLQNAALETTPIPRTTHPCNNNKSPPPSSQRSRSKKRKAKQRSAEPKTNTTTTAISSKTKTLSTLWATSDTAILEEMFNGDDDDDESIPEQTMEPTGETAAATVHVQTGSDETAKKQQGPSLFQPSSYSNMDLDDLFDDDDD